MAQPSTGEIRENPGAVPAGSELPVSKRYQAGTLSYSTGGLITLFLWLLWGDFCFTLMETVMPQLLPLSLRDLGAKNALIGVIVGSLPSVMTMVFCPVVSTASDRHRGRYGRRIPFLFWPTPFLVFFLVLIGYSSDIGSWLHGAFLGRVFHLSPLSAVLGVVCVCIVGFQFFNVFISSIYYYLWADVVPSACMGRFVALFRMVGQFAGFIWGRYIFGLATSHMKEIYVGIGLLYLVSFLLICWRVEEGEYPPPSTAANGPGWLNSIKTYVQECFTVPFYLWYFLISVMFWASQAANMFLVFFPRNNLKLSLDEIGRVNSWCNLTSIPLLMGFGFLADRVHPIRMVFIGLVALFGISVASYLGIKDENTFLICSILYNCASLCYLTAFLPLCVRIFPSAKYGQFASAQAMIYSIGLIASTYGAGVFMDWIKDYRCVFVWRSVFFGLMFIPLIVVYRAWRRCGGVKHYVPPQVRE